MNVAGENIGYVGSYPLEVKTSAPDLLSIPEDPNVAYKYLEKVTAPMFGTAFHSIVSQESEESSEIYEKLDEILREKDMLGHIFPDIKMPKGRILDNFSEEELLSLRKEISVEEGCIKSNWLPFVISRNRESMLNDNWGKWVKLLDLNKETLIDRALVSVINARILRGKDSSGMSAIDRMGKRVALFIDEKEYIEFPELTMDTKHLNYLKYLQKTPFTEILRKAQDRGIKSPEELRERIVLGRTLLMEEPKEHLKIKEIKDYLYQLKSEVEDFNEGEIIDALLGSEDQVFEKYINSLGDDPIKEDFRLSRYIHIFNHVLMTSYKLPSTGKSIEYATARTRYDFVLMSLSKSFPVDVEWDLKESGGFQRGVLEQEKEIVQIGRLLLDFDRYLDRNSPGLRNEIKSIWESKSENSVNLSLDDFRSIYKQKNFDNTPLLYRSWIEFCKDRDFKEGIGFSALAVELKNGDNPDGDDKAKEMRRIHALLFLVYSSSHNPQEDFNTWLESGAYKYLVLLRDFFRLDSAIFNGFNPTGEGKASYSVVSSDKDFSKSLNKAGKEIPIILRQIIDSLRESGFDLQETTKLP